MDNQTCINYIKNTYPKIVFNPLHINNASKALGFIVSDNKLILGYISKDGTLNKLGEPINITKISNNDLIDSIKKIPIISGFDESNKNSLIKLLENVKDTITENERIKLIKEIKEQITTEKDAEYKVLYDNKCQTLQDSLDINSQNIVLIKKEYTDKITEIKEQYEKTIKDLNTSQEICKNKILTEKEYIISAILTFKKNVADYIKSRDLTSQKEIERLNKLYQTIVEEKREIEKMLESVKNKGNMELEEIRKQDLERQEILKQEYEQQLEREKQMSKELSELLNQKENQLNEKSNELSSQLSELSNKNSELSENLSEKISEISEIKSKFMSEITDLKSQLSEKDLQFNQKGDILIAKEKEIDELKSSIETIKKELEDATSRHALEKIAIEETKNKCIKKILAEKDSIIESINQYNQQWFEWIKQNKYDIEEYKNKIKAELQTIFKNLSKVLEHKNKFIQDLELSDKQKDVLIKRLESNAIDIKTAVQKALAEQFLELSAQKEREETSVDSGYSSPVLDDRDDLIRSLREELERVKQQLDQNNNTKVPKEIDYNNCFAVIKKYISISNIFSRKNEIIKSLDRIINGTDSNNDPNIEKFNKLSEGEKETIRNTFNDIQNRIKVFMEFLNIKEYTELTNKYKDSVKLLKSNPPPPDFCPNLIDIIEQWDLRVLEFREQDRRLTNLYEDLSGAVRVYIKEKPLIVNGKLISSGTIVPVDIDGKPIGYDKENKIFNVSEVKKQKRLVIDCSNVPLEKLNGDSSLQKSQVYGDFYGIFDSSYSNLDSYTGIKNSKSLLKNGDLLVDLDAIVEDRDSVSPGLYSSFKQVEDGYSIVLFGYGLSGAGKCLAKDTPVLMFDGTIKKVQDVVDGDVVMGDDSKPRNVFGVTSGRDTMYKITNVKGESYTVNSEHILSLTYTGKKQIRDRTNRHSFIITWFNNKKIGFNTKTFSYKNKDKTEVYNEAIEFYNNVKEDYKLDISIKKYLNLSNHFKNFLKGYKVGVEFKEKNVEIDPYMIGYWLGDGTSCVSSITSQDSAVLYYFSQNLAKYNCYLKYQESSEYVYRINTTEKRNYFMTTLKQYNLLNNKHIPLAYKCNSREQRLKLLAGLLDSDGSYDKKKCFYEFSQSFEHERLIDDVIYLCHSLGFACYKNIKNTSWTHKGVKNYGKAWRICISGEGLEQIPTVIPRKRASPRRQIKDVLVSGITVTKLKEDDYYGFAVDGNHRFLLGNFTVTHNTFSLLGTKTTPGIVHYGLANLEDVKSIRILNLFEHYVSRINTTNNLATVAKVINLVGKLPKEFDNYQKLSDERDPFEKELYQNASDINVQNIKVSNISRLTEVIDNYRINRKRIKETPNNDKSSRSHLFFVFEVTFTNGRQGYITIVDTAGRESPLEIANIFLNLPNKVEQQKQKMASLLGLSGGVNAVSRIQRQDLFKSDGEKYDPTSVYEILKEGIFINETINHLIYFFNKKNYKTTNVKKIKNFEEYSTDKYFVNPATEDAGEINANNNCLMIPIMKYLDNLSKNAVSQSNKPTKFITLVAVRQEEEKCGQIFATLDFAENIKST